MSLYIILGLFATLLVISCRGTRGSSPSTGDLFYLTPIPEETITAFSPEKTITSKLDAVIAARRLMATTRLEFVTTPAVKYVDQITLGQALKRENVPTQEYQFYKSSDTQVWLVAFEGDAQVTPPQSGTPDPAQTPASITASTRCTFVILESNQTGSVRSIPVPCPEP